MPRLRGMASCTLVSDLPRSLPPLPPGPTPTCVPCVEGRQRAAPHSSTFPPIEAPLQTLHMDVWGPARVRGQGHERYFLLVVDNYSRYTTVFLLRSKGEVPEVLIDWICDRGGEFSSDLLRAFYRAEGIRQTFTLPASPQQNGIAERHISMVMDVARTSMIHAPAPHFQWPFVVQYAAHQINLQPRVSLPETTPTLRWTGKVGDASAFSVWGSRAFVRDTSADKLSSCAVPCVFLGFPPDTPGWQFHLPTSCRVLSSQDIKFDESVSYYSLFPYRTASLPPPPLFLAPGTPPVDPLPPQGPAPSGVSQVDPTEPVEVAVDLGAARGAEPACAGTWGAEIGGAEPGGAKPERWYARRCRRATGAPSAGAARGAAGAGATGGAAGAGGAGGAAGAGAARGATGAGASGGAAGAGAVGGPLELVSRPVLPNSCPASPQSCYESPIHTVRSGRRVSRQSPPPVHGTHSMTLRPSTAPQRVPLPSPPASSLLDGPDQESDSLRAASPTVKSFLATAVTDPLFESTATSALVAELLDFATACRLDYAIGLVVVSASESVCPPSVGGECALGTDVLEDRQEEFECFAIAGPYSSQWQAAMDAEMASWKSTGTYVDEVPLPRVNIVSGMWIFKVKRSSGSPPVFKARYVARGFSQRQGVHFFQTFSPTPKMTTLRWPVYSLRQAPREWHGTLRTSLAALGFAPSTAHPSLFLCTNTTLPPFYVLVYVDDLVFTTADTEAHDHVMSELQKRHISTDLGELTSYLGLRITRDRGQCTITLTQSHMVQQVLQRFGFTYSSPQSTPLPTGHSLSAPPLDESVEPSGPYPELVGCIIYLMTCTRPDLAYPLSLLARSVAPGRHRKELRWLTYLLTDLGEAPRSPPVLYVDNKAMLALCQEHRLEHRTKHIALRYFLARELQQRGQLRLAYVASQANTADVFTKALQPCDHQPCFAFVDWSCDLLFSPTLPMG
ncbi:unnamed protein product, partial [Closterium sp. NIES-53]